MNSPEFQALPEISGCSQEDFKQPSSPFPMQAPNIAAERKEDSTARCKYSPLNLTGREGSVHRCLPSLQWQCQAPAGKRERLCVQRASDRMEDAVEATEELETPSLHT